MRQFALALLALPLSAAVALADPPGAKGAPDLPALVLLASVTDKDDDRAAPKKDTRPVLAAPVIEEPKPAVRRKVARAADATEPRRKRMTKMPWMTGVYQ